MRHDIATSGKPVEERMATILVVDDNGSTREFLGGSPAASEPCRS
jgi:hypothetical protein